MDAPIGTYGQYEVWTVYESFDTPRYAVVNAETGITEHDTPVLHQAIRVAKIFDKALIEAHKFDPNSLGWNSQQEPGGTANDIH